MIFALLALLCLFMSFRVSFLAGYQYFHSRIPLLSLQYSSLSSFFILVIDIASYPVRNIKFILTLPSLSLPMLKLLLLFTYHSVAASLIMAALGRGWPGCQEIQYSNCFRGC